MKTSTEDLILKAQAAEITEYHIYRNLSHMTRDKHNREVLEQISDEEMQHHEFWQSHTGVTVKPSKLKILFYTVLARVFGLTFAIRLMEAGEDLAQRTYQIISEEIPQATEIEQDEMDHEEQLINMIEEERLQYASSIVLGLNDALVELTGTIAGLTLALQNTKLVAIASLVTGISAALSMAGSEYLSTKTDETEVKHPMKASVYTGVAYIFAVAILIFPYFVMHSPFAGLAWTMLNALLIILVFNFYISVAKSYSFARRFFEMAGISLGVAAISFLIGLGIRHLIGVSI